MDYLRKYWWYFVIGFIIVPIILNIILLIPAFTPIVGDNTVWLSFFGSLIGALASFVMIFFTAKTLEQNKQQLDELRRQWDDEHLPYLSCQLISSGNYFKLRILNSAKVVAKDVSVDIENCLENEGVHRLSNLQEFLKNQSFIIPPLESIYFDTLITAYKDIENLPKGFIKVSLKSGNKDFDTFQLYPSNYAYMSFEKANIGREIVDSISKVSQSITNKKFLFK